MKGKKWIVSGIMIAICLAILGCMFLGYLSVDLTSVIKDSIPFSNRLNILEDLFGGLHGKLEMSGFEIIKTLFSKPANLDSSGGKLLFWIRMFVLIPYIAVLLVFIFSFFRRTWSYITTLVLSTGSLIFSLVFLIFSLPGAISKQISDTVSNVTESLTEQSSLPGVIQSGIAILSETVNDSVDKTVSAGQIRSLLFKGVGPGWIVTIIGLVLLIALSVIGIVLCVKSKSRGHIPESISEPSMIFLFGEFRNTPIPLSVDDSVVIGSDPAFSHIILNDNGIEGRHIEIGYNEARDKYWFRVFGQATVSFNGKKYSGQDKHYVDGGILDLGGNNRIRLTD